MSLENIAAEDVLLVVDVQCDFCPGGALEVSRGDEIVPLVSELAGRFKHVIQTQDWHPPGHLSFASSHEGATTWWKMNAVHETDGEYPCAAGTVEPQDLTLFFVSYAPIV